MTEADFWDLTPREFSLLVERRRLEQRADDYRSSVAAVILGNVYRKPHSRAREGGDYFASLRPDAGASIEPHCQTPEQQLALFQALFAGRITHKNNQPV